MRLTVGSLFSGIGGLDLGLERAGMTVAWQSEIDPYACRVLAKHWPHVPNLGDITAIDWSTVEPVDIIAGGYPCQPFSLAGTRNGEDDPRHLWPHMLRAIRRVRPRFALLENVPGHLSMGFGRVLGDLAESGYRVEWDCIPAAAVGAPHRRDRVFAVAYTDRCRRHGDMRVQPAGGSEVRDEARCNAGAVRAVEGADVADTAGRGASAGEQQGQLRLVEQSGAAPDTDREPLGRTAISRSQRGHWAVEPDVGRVAHGVPSRVDRLRCLGNAVVPQVAEWIGRRILEAAA